MKHLFVLARERDELALGEDGAYLGVYLSVSPRTVCCWSPAVASQSFLLLLFSCSVISVSFQTPWTVARQAPLSAGFSRQEHEWVAMSFSRASSRPRDGPLISCKSPAMQVDSLQLSHRASLNRSKTEP